MYHVIKIITAVILKHKMAFQNQDTIETFSIEIQTRGKKSPSLN